MRTITLADIRAKSPCYDPATKVSEDWAGTVVDILRLNNVTQQDRLWAAAWAAAGDAAWAAAGDAQISHLIKLIEGGAD